jgi:cyclopropane fatty-acyl-phospholipid synthase-like methyltransferase
MNQDFFGQKAETYEKDDKIVSNVDNIASAVIENVQLDRNMHLVDFGSGTGLLLEHIAPSVRKITAIDISKAMNEQLEQKRGQLRCELDILEVDLELTDIGSQYDGIISSMAMHHVKNIEAMFAKFYAMLKEGGFIALSDLDSEDGSFHTRGADGVYHFGFDRYAFAAAAKQAGFREVKVVDASVVHRPHGQFPVFLLTAKR